jgi:HlyD family secretion protein
MRECVCRYRASLVLPAAVLLVLAAGCQGPAEGTSITETALQPSTQVSAAPAVPIIYPERKTVRHKIEQPGFNIEAFQETPIYAHVTGYAIWKKWKIDIGDHVRKDQLLAELYVPDLEDTLRQKEAAITQAKAQILVAHAAVSNAKALLDRFKSQYERLARVERGTGSLDKENVEETRLQYESAKAGLEKANADVKLAQARLDVAKADRAFAKTMWDYRKLLAPFTGVVTKRNVNDGDFIQPGAMGDKGKPLFVVMQIDPVRIFVNVPGTDARWIKDGDLVTMQLQGAGGTVLVGKVTRNARSLDPAARTLRTEIDLPNPKGKLLPGMYVQASIAVKHPNVWTLPEAALVTEGDQTICFRVVNGKAVRTPLQIGLRGVGLVEVLKKRLPPPAPSEEGQWEEISGQEEIVASNPAALSEGQVIRK